TRPSGTIKNSGSPRRTARTNVRSGSAMSRRPRLRTGVRRTIPGFVPGRTLDVRRRLNDAKFQAIAPTSARWERQAGGQHRRAPYRLPTDRRRPPTAPPSRLLRRYPALVQAAGGSVERIRYDRLGCTWLGPTVRPTRDLSNA